MALSDEAEGRSIHSTINVTFTPPETNNPGHTDAAMDIGRGLIREATLLLKNAGEAEGFTVNIETRQVVY